MGDRLARRDLDRGSNKFFRNAVYIFAFTVWNLMECKYNIFENVEEKLVCEQMD